MTLVKICGVSEPGHARAAASLGADFIGIVFASAWRQVTLDQAKRVAAALRQSLPVRQAGSEQVLELPSGDASSAYIESLLRKRRPLLVGVFADQEADTINAIADDVGLDLIQLSGSEPWEFCRLLKRPVLKSSKVHDGQAAEEVLAGIGEGAIAHLDSYVEGAYGGAGRNLDWSIAAEVARRLPVMLAGGLRPDNVAHAIRIVRPWAVDVSSGVETERIKDVKKIRAFIQAAKATNR